MSSPLWQRLSGIGQGLGTVLSGLGVVRRGRQALAGGIRGSTEHLRTAVWGYIGLLLLLGMTTAGLVLLPVGLLLLGRSLLRESADQVLVGGLFLCLVGLFYVLGPLVVVRIVAGSALDRLQRRAERLAAQVEGHE
jgi:hypothetical protein